MIIGGPFAFLAGLFCLGAAAIDGALHSSDTTALSRLEEQRKAEMAKHNYMPEKIQRTFEGLVKLHNQLTDGAIGGFDLYAIEGDMYRELFSTHTLKLAHGVLPRDVAACAIAKYYIEEVFHFEYCYQNARVPISDSTDLDKWTHNPKYISQKALEYIDMPWEKLIYNEVARKYYHGYYIFHKRLAEFMQEGLIDGVDLGDWKQLPPPEECNPNQHKHFWLY